jgi:hypothetical protein
MKKKERPTMLKIMAITMMLAGAVIAPSACRTRGSQQAQGPELEQLFQNGTSEVECVMIIRPNQAAEILGEDC